MKWNDKFFHTANERKELKNPTRKPTYSAMYLPNGELTELGKRWKAKQEAKKDGEK